MGFQRKSVYLAVLTGASQQSLLTSAAALGEGYQVVQRQTLTAASKAINQLSVRFAAGDDQLARLVRKDQDLAAENERLDNLIIQAVSKEPAKRNSATEQQIRDRIRSVRVERAQVETVLDQRFPDYAALAKPEPLSVQETQGLLAADEVLVVFDFGQRSYAGVFTQSDAAAFELKITATELDAEVKNLRASISYSPRFDAEASYRLYISLFGPFAEYVKSKKRLSFVTNGALTSLPLQLLVASDPAGKELKDIDWLIRGFAITVLPSVSSLKVLRTKPPVKASKPMIGFGDPVLEKTVQKITTRKLTSFEPNLSK
jgi:CHAT domain